MKKTRLAVKLAAGAAALSIMAGAMPLSASAEWQQIGYLGDLNRDKAVNVADLVLMSKHMLGQQSLTSENFYKVDNAFVGISGADGFQPGEFLKTADIDQDGKVNSFDFVALREHITANNAPVVWQWYNDEPQPQKQPTEAPVSDVDGNLPSLGEGKLLILYVDFPDCQYNYLPTTDEIEEFAFGAEDTSDANYPFESMTAFYKRSSKGAMNLSGKAYRYTAQKNVADYADIAGRQELLREAMRAIDADVDYTQFDGDNDGNIDAALLAVPKAAGDDNWWPCAGPLGDENFTVDGMKVGHLITGNAQIESATDYSNFNSTYLHEMGHCMGLPDYYLYHGSDTEGMHGTAGSELMDDATSDFSCVSKLQLGWYKDDQIAIFDNSMTSETYTLSNAQTDSGNVLVIPCGDLDSRYHSEYMLVEYTTSDANNSKPGWWVNIANGIRIYHVDATLYDNGWWTSYKYGSGSEFTNNDAGRRLLRIIDDRDVDNTYRTGDIINGNISGFHWYDSNGDQTIDTGITITVGEQVGDSYQITVSRNN